MRRIIVCIFGIIVKKLGYWYKLGPIVLLEIDKNLEVRWHYAVLLLSLTVSLRVKYGRKPTFDAKKEEEQWPDF